MKAEKGSPTGGILAISGKEFSCAVGDSIEAIAKVNFHLSTDEVQQVYNITREQLEEAPKTT